MDVLRHVFFQACVPFRVLARGLDIAEPCIGLGGFRELSTVGEFPYGDGRSYAYDMDSRLQNFYDKRKSETQA